MSELGIFLFRNKIAKKSRRWSLQKISTKIFSLYFANQAILRRKFIFSKFYPKILFWKKILLLKLPDSQSKVEMLKSIFWPACFFGLLFWDLWRWARFRQKCAQFRLRWFRNFAEGFERDGAPWVAPIKPRIPGKWCFLELISISRLHQGYLGYCCSNNFDYKSRTWLSDLIQNFILR